ncbi:MAG: hypothetical protein IH610_06360 [Deltaproteobacteria bacterium]|nr:hypothetical protein [Deltaproteobacteria bacterium]
MRTTALKLLIGLAFAATIALWGPPSARADGDGFDGAEIVPQQELDAARGGYQAGKDLMFSFGVEKATFLNGVLQATSSLNLLHPSGEGSQASSVPMFNLVQNGPGIPNNGKDFSAFTLPGQGFQGTILQNSLDKQWITNVTKINVGLNVLGAFRANNLSTVLNQQLIRSGR